MNFKILKQTEEKDFIPIAENHLKTLSEIKNNFSSVSGEKFIQDWINVFSETGSPIFVNLDHNASGKTKDINELVAISKKTVEELKEIVRATAGEVSAYKMNEQSMLTFLIAGFPNFVNDIKEIYRKECERKFEVSIEPIVWTDEKLRDIPSTTFQTADIILSLGYDAIHCMPQLGPYVSGEAQMAAERHGGKGLIHVINLTHDGYKYVKQNYFKNETLDLLRKNALNQKSLVDIGKGSTEVRIKATGTIEPANRPFEIFQSLKVYGKNIMIVSIGIGPQGALPGCALYAGATCEGIGRFIFRGKDGLETSENMNKKARLCKKSALLALKAKYSKQIYPLDNILKELAEFNPKIRDEIKLELEKIYLGRK